MERVLLSFQHLAKSIRDTSKQPDLTAKQQRSLSILLKLSLDGAVRSKATIESQLLTHSVSNEIDDEKELLAVLRARFQAIQPNYNASEVAMSTAEQRRCILALDIEILWNRHRANARATGVEPGRFLDFLAVSTEYDLTSTRSGDTFEKKATGMHAWEPPLGHTTFSWRGHCSTCRGDHSKCIRPRGHPHLSLPTNSFTNLRVLPSSISCPNAGLLLRIVAHVRSVESKDSFQRSLIYDQKVLASRLGVDRETFAYGSTPFLSWQKLFEGNCNTLDDAIRRCKFERQTILGEEKQRSYVVFGSAMGLLAFYGAVGLGLRTLGYEILPCLARSASEIAKSFGLCDDTVESTSNPQLLRLVEGDMLNADIKEAGVVLLTSQCWDYELKKKVYTKLATELQRDALIIDYTPGLGCFSLESTGTGGPLGNEMNTVKTRFCFLEVKSAKVVTSVSWNASQPFYVFKFAC